MKRIQHHDLTGLSERARQHARLRMNFNLHT
jgi:hypothetical protein